MSRAQVSQRNLRKDPGATATLREVRCSLPEMRRGPLPLLLALVVLLLAPSGALAQSTPADRALSKDLTKQMRAAGPFSGAYVLDADNRTTLFKWKPDTPRILASNTKLFTAAGVVNKLGPEATLSTTVVGSGTQEPDGTYRGDLYLRGAGDPTFGSSSFVSRNYGTGGTVDDLADQIEGAGITSVTGRVYGDESRFDSLRGGPDSGYGTSIWVGPLSALSYNRGLANDRGSAFQSNPPAFAAGRLDAVLEDRGVSVRGKPAVGQAPAGATQLAVTQSPALQDMLRQMLKPSDNFFAEMLIKQLGSEPGTTRSGTAAAASFAAGLGSRVQMVDGSGLSRGNRASPRSVGRLIDGLMTRSEWPAIDAALPIAGKDGTLHDRMRSSPARGRCRAKTGTISGVSTLSGYCKSRSGDRLVFSFLMNGVSTTGARRLQDRMAMALARYNG
jgi:serine-type D-Ala-D-Ala carboxypeptidase/endopeptidase (penicillin-binding protein 4)